MLVFPADVDGGVIADRTTEKGLATSYKLTTDSQPRVRTKGVWWFSDPVMWMVVLSFSG